MREEKVFKTFLASFGILWVVGMVMGLATSGLILYILYRVATHPW